MPAAASGVASDASTPTAVKGKGPTSLRTRQSRSARTVRGTRSAGQMIANSSGVNVMLTNGPAAHAGTGEDRLRDHRSADQGDDVVLGARHDRSTELVGRPRDLAGLTVHELDAVAQGLEELRLDELVTRLEAGSRPAAQAA